MLTDANKHFEHGYEIDHFRAMAFIGHGAKYR
jgi:hypothetical protein